MAKKIELKTKKNAGSVSAFLNGVEHKERREDAKAVLKLMKKITKKTPKMWGDSIVGFGSYHYKRKSGDEADFFATGFSPRKTALALYIMPGYKNYGHLLKKLGPHTKSVSCLYIKHLKDIDLKVLETLVRQGLKDLEKTHVVK